MQTNEEKKEKISSPTKKKQRKVKQVHLVSLAEKEATAKGDGTEAAVSKRQKMEKLSSIMEAASSLITLGGNTNSAISSPKTSPTAAAEDAPHPHPIVADTTADNMMSAAVATAVRENTQRQQHQLQQRRINNNYGGSAVPALLQGGVKIITNTMLSTLEQTIKSSKDSQSKLQEWDRDVMGLDKQHSQTMRDTAKSRKDILKVLQSKNKRNLLLKHQHKEKQKIMLLQQQRQEEEEENKRRQQQELQLAQQQRHEIEKEEIERLNQEKNVLLSALMESKVKYQQEQHKRRILEQRAAFASALSSPSNTNNTTADTTAAEALLPRYGGTAAANVSVPGVGGMSSSLFSRSSDLSTKLSSMKHMMLSQPHHHHGLVGGTGLLSFLPTPTRMQQGGRTA